LQDDDDNDDERRTEACQRYDVDQLPGARQTQRLRYTLALHSHTTNSR